jgi:hypothetical protein
MKFARALFIVSGIFASLAPLQIRALPDAEAAAGRLVARRFGDAVVAVRGAVALRITLNDRPLPQAEQKFDLNGTVITPAGLTVVSLSQLDPKAIYEATRAQMNAGAAPVTFGNTEFRNLRIRVGSGKEYPVKIVFKNTELDVAFLLPEGPPPAPGQEFTYVDLNQAAESAKLLSDYYLVVRAPDVFQRMVLVKPTTITGILERPRRRLLVNTDADPDSLGTPVFDAQGKVLGIHLRVVDSGLPKGAALVPAADIATVVAQNAPE